MAMPRYRLYDNGAALGYILDFLGRDWKHAAASDSAFSFHRFLLEAFHVNPDSATVLAPLVLREVGYAKTAAAAHRRISLYHQDLRSLRRNIETSGKVKVSITFPKGTHLKRSKSTTGRVCYTDIGHTTLIEHARYFDMNSTSSTETTTVSVKDRGLVYSMSSSEDTVFLCFCLGTLPETLAIDGRKVPAEVGTYDGERSINVEVPGYFELDARGGVIKVSPGNLTIVAR